MGLRYRAVIFDLDGVLWDGEPLYHEAFNIVLDPLGHRVSDEDYVNVIGHGVEEAWEWMRERFQLKEAPRRFLQSYDTAVLRLLNKLYELELSDEELATVGAVVGSDVAFFVYGGTALVEGKGERLTSLREAPETWVVLIVPPVSPVSKTVSMYESLTEDDFTDGSNTIAAAEEVRHGKVIDDWHMRNVFERAAFECFPDLVAYRYSLLRAGASAVYLAGSGPGLFSRSTDRAGAERIAGNVKAGGGKVIVARTVGATEATAVTD